MPVFLRTESRQAVLLPAVLSYRQKADSVEQKTHWCWFFFQTPLQKIGQILRNAFYLPCYSKTIFSDFELNQQLAEKITQALKNSEVFCPEEQNMIRRFFSVRDIAIRLEGTVSQIFTIRVFEPKMPIGQKKLRMVLFSFNGNMETQGSTKPQKWNPSTIQALSKSPILVLKVLKSSGIYVDSLITTSLGNVILDGLKHFAAEEDFGTLPPTLIINKGLTSIKKVANQLYAFPLNYLLHGAAKLSGWDANPEQELLHFLEKEKQASLPSQRKIVFIEVLKDFYFSEKGRFSLDTHEKIAALGHKVFRASFYPFPFHLRAHHALSLDHLVNNSLTEQLIDTIQLDLSPNEKMTSAIAKNIFLNGSEECHTCFYICGNDATLDVGTAREVLPLLSAFIEEGQKLAQKDSTDGDKEQRAS